MVSVLLRPPRDSSEVEMVADPDVPAGAADDPVEVPRRVDLTEARERALRTERNALQRRAEEAERALEAHERHYRDAVMSYCAEIDRLKKELRDVRHHVSPRPDDELKALRREHFHLRLERDRLGDRVTELIRELARRRVDRPAIFTSIDTTTEEIRIDLHRYLDQELPQVAHMVWSHRCRIDAALDGQRRQEIAHTQAVLIGVSLVQESTREIMARVDAYIRSAGACLRDMRCETAARLELLGVIEGVLAHATSGADERPDERDHRRHAAVRHIGDSLRIVLDADRALEARLDQFVEDGWLLAQAIGRTEPAGELFAVVPGTPFDPAQHLRHAGSTESGVVAWTVQPGYRQGSRIVDLPVVFVA